MRSVLIHFPLPLPPHHRPHIGGGDGGNIRERKGYSLLESNCPSVFFLKGKFAGVIALFLYRFYCRLALDVFSHHSAPFAYCSS